MKAVSVGGDSTVSVDEARVPTPGSGEILVRMQACGICGSDLEKVFGRYGKTSVRLGHEPAGIVAEVGDGVTDLRTGDRVFTHHHVPCYSCHLCTHGSETSCPKYSETNLSPCGLSEQYVVSAWHVSHGGVLKLPDNVSFEEAAMIEPLACCIRAWRKLSYREGDSVAVFGVGPAGMMHVLLARYRRLSKIFCFDVNGFRLDFAKKLGVTHSIHSEDGDRLQKVLENTKGCGVDIAIVATGSLDALRDAIDMVRSGGTVMMFGVPSRGATMSIDMSRIYAKEISLLTSYAASDTDTSEALDLIASSGVDIKRLITHSYPIAESQKAFDHARAGRDAMKIVITK